MVPDHTRGAHPTVSGPRYVDYAVDPAERGVGDADDPAEHAR